MPKTQRIIAMLAEALIFGFFQGGLIQAQQERPAEIQKEETQQSPVAPCLQPPPLVSWEDYRGPFQKAVGTFERKLERKSARVPRYKPGTVLCSLEIKDKFMLFVGDTLDPISFLSSAYNAGLDQATNQDPSFGPGMAGYGRRFAANLASDTTGRFLGDFVYPTIFGEDPRYYRLAHGTVRTRLVHAMGHVVIAHRDSGARMFNFSEWFTLTTAVVVNNVYHPGNTRGFVAGAEGVGTAVGIDMGSNILREFWPEIARKLKMPFRNPDPQPSSTP